ncbi:hypothetical protein L208DRAFT_1410394 [Tricholoma matsutake]|nr:hypothetical protein L208DRAFT_1410394 [Tricholoma matsutake 945]
MYTLPKLLFLLLLLLPITAFALPITTKPIESKTKTKQNDKRNSNPPNPQPLPLAQLLSTSPRSVHLNPLHPPVPADKISKDSSLSGWNGQQKRHRT